MNCLEQIRRFLENLGNGILDACNGYLMLEVRYVIYILHTKPYSHAWSNGLTRCRYSI